VYTGEVSLAAGLMAERLRPLLLLRVERLHLLQGPGLVIASVSGGAEVVHLGGDETGQGVARGAEVLARVKLARLLDEDLADCRFADDPAPPGGLQYYSATPGSPEK